MNNAKWKENSWGESEFEWEQATTGCGYIQPSPPGPRRFELWRGATDLPGYACLVQSKRKVLQKLLTHGRTFGPRGRRVHKSFLVVDTPGSGKSYMARQLARTLEMRYLEFNITQMHTRNDLLQCFDTIVTDQAQDPDNIVFVFIDEVDAKIAGEHVFDAFLAPLEDGFYVRSGNRFHIEPCLWLFAGTTMPDTSRLELGHATAQKGSDFVSRLTESPFNLKAGLEKGDTIDQVKMERVYVGVSSVCGHFPDVRQISRKVLMIFKHLHDDLEARDIRQLVKRSHDIQYGIVTSANLPSDWLHYCTFDDETSDEWSEVLAQDAKAEEDELIEIVTGGA